MKLDLNKGTYIEIGGELGMYNTLPIDVLIKLAQDLQELIMSLAKHDLPSTDLINLDNFKIELVDFKKGSAVPKFAFTPRVENKVGQNWEIHRKQISDKFQNLIEVSDSGNYGKIIELYPEPERRNDIVENLYSFINDFGNAPVNFVEFDDKSDKIIQLYKVNKFKPSVKKTLIADIKETKKDEAETDEAVGKIKIIKTGNKIKKRIITTYSQSKYSLEYAPEIIIAGDSKYILKYPLRCLFEKEDDYFVIQSEMLGIIGTGLTEDDAEQSFNEEFDFIYNKLYSLDNEKLTNHNILIKSILDHIVEKIEK